MATSAAYGARGRGAVQGIAALAPRAAWPQGGAPLGPEFRVNTYTTSNQLYPSVARAAGGNFVVVWTSNTLDDLALGVFGQRYVDTGAPLGPEFPVNTYTTGSRPRPQWPSCPRMGSPHRRAPRNLDAARRGSIA